MKIYVTFIILIITLLFHKVNASPLKLESVLESTNTHFPLIIAAKADIAKAEANLLSSKGGFDPVLKSDFVTSAVGVYKNGYSNTELSAPISDTGNKVFTGYRIGRGDFPVYEQQKWTYNQGEVRAGIEIPILRDKKIDDRRAKILLSKADVVLNEQELQLQKLDITKNASFSYWDWVGEGIKLRIQTHLLDLAETRQNVINDRYKRGDAPQIEVTENNRIITQRKIALEIQKQYFLKASLLLSLYYRDGNGKPIIPTINNLPNDINEVTTSVSDSTNDLYQFMLNHPSMKQIEQMRTISLINLSVAENNLLPKLNNRFYVARDFGPGSPPLNRTSINYELSFELPIYMRQARGQINASKNMLEKIDAEQQITLDKIHIGITNSMNQIDLAHRVLVLTRSELKMAKNLEEAERIKYQHGDSNLFLVNLREQSTVETETRLINAIADYHKANADYQYSTGRIPN